MQDTLVIINPKSGKKGLREKKRKNLYDFFRKENRFLVEITEHVGHASEIVKHHLFDFSIQIVIVVGGDGTINEVASILINTEKTLLILPLGSGNGLWNYFHSKKRVNFKKILEKIKSKKHKTILIDTLLVNQHSFVNVAGLGFDGAVAKTFSKSIRRGLISYCWITISKYLLQRPIKCNVTVNQKKLEGNYLMISFANGTQFGNHICISPHSKIDDGKFEICMVKKPPLWQLFSFSCDFLFTRQLTSNYITYESTTRCVVEIDEEAPLHVDGEFIASNKKHYEVVINPHSLKIAVFSE